MRLFSLAISSIMMFTQGCIDVTTTTMTSSTHGDDEVNYDESCPDDGSSSENPSDSTWNSDDEGTTTSDPHSEESGTTIGEEAGCSDFSIGDLDLFYSGCCKQTAMPCTTWCEMHGFVGCKFVGFYYEDECGGDVAYAGACDYESWRALAPQPKGVQCICG